MEDKRPGVASGDESERRHFLQTVVTAAAGLTLGTAAAPAARAAGAEDRRQRTVDAATQATLLERLRTFADAARTGDIGDLRRYFHADADFRSVGGIQRGWKQIEISQAKVEGDASLAQRAVAQVTNIKWLSREAALVDAVYETERGRGWFTEVWDASDGEFAVRTMRLRVGPADGSFKALSPLESTTVDGDVPAAVQRGEDELLRARFKEFRAAFNSGNVEGVMALASPTLDALPVFGFLGGRSQSMPDSASVETKTAQMLGTIAVSEAGLPGAQSTVVPGERKSAVFLGGEPKFVRFLSPTLAVVDGTAQIGNIPMAHGFAPKEMRGVYSVVWRMHEGAWTGEAARAWF